MPAADDIPAIGQDIVAQPPVEHQLVAGGLDHLRRRGQLVEEEDALSLTGKEVGHEPPSGVTVDAGKAAQVDGVEQNGAQVDEVDVPRNGQVADNVGFADAGGAPNVHGDVFAKRAVERFDKGRRGHGLLAFRRWGKKVGLEKCRGQGIDDWRSRSGERGLRPGVSSLVLAPVSSGQLSLLRHPVAIRPAWL